MKESNYTLTDDWLIDRLQDDATNSTTTISTSTNGAIFITGSLVVVYQSSPSTTTVSPPTSPATVLVVVNVTSNSAYYWSTTSSQDELDQINTALLWLPYVIFTIVLLGLIAVSFLKFHCERGNQYRRRQAEISDKLQHVNVQDSLRLLPTSSQEAEMMTSLHLGGGVSLMPGSALQQPNGFGPAKDGIPQHMNLFVQYSQINPGNKPHEEAADNEEDTCQIVSLDDSKKKYHEDDLKSDHKSKKMFFFSGKDNKKKGGSTGSGSRRPIVFTFNCNGSMVDVRCDNEERTNTFRLTAMNYMSDEPTSGEYDKHRRSNKQFVAKYSKSRPHLHSSREQQANIENPSCVDAKVIRQNTLPPPPITNGLPIEPSKRLVKNRSLEIAPPVPIFDPLKHATKDLAIPYCHSPLFVKYSNPSTLIAPSLTPLFSQTAFTQMHLASVNLTTASLMSPNSAMINLSPGVINHASAPINLPPPPPPPQPETSFGGHTRQGRPQAELQPQFLNSSQMLTQTTYTFPISQRQQYYQHQFPTLLQSPTSESANQSQQNKEQLLIRMHQQQSLLQQKLLQNKQQFMHTKEPSFDKEPSFISYAMENFPGSFQSQRSQQSCPHQPNKPIQQSIPQNGQQISQQKSQQTRHQQPAKVSVHQPSRLPKSAEQSVVSQGQNKRASQTQGQSGQSGKQQSFFSQDTPQRSRNLVKTTQPLTTHPQQQSSTTYPSSLAHQPFFSARRQHNRSAQTIFAANRGPIFGAEKRNRESEIENEALLLWQKQI